MDDIKIRLALDGADQVQANANKAAEGLGKLGAAAQKTNQQGQLTGYQLQQVSAQLQDLFVQIQGGQAPLTAFLQQGSQLSAVFGGAGSALRAVGGFLGTLITPLTGVVAAVAALGLAWKQGSDETVAYSRSLILTGNAAGVTIGQLKAMAQAQSQVIGTQGAAAESLAALAATGQVTSASLGAAAEAATRLARVGVPLQDTVKKFADLGRDPLKALLDLNQAENFLTESVYKQVKALVEQGRAQEASVAAQKAYADVGIQRAKDLEASLGTLQTAWKTVGDVAAKAWDRMLNVGRPVTLADQLAAVQKQITDLPQLQARQSSPLLGSRITTNAQDEAALANRRQSLELVAENLREQLRLESRLNTSANERNQLEQARIKWLSEGDKYLTKQQQAEREITRIRKEGAEAGATQLEIETRVAATRAKYADTGGDNELAQLRAKLKETNDLIASLSQQGAIVRELNDGERTALRLQEEIKNTLSSTVRAEKERALALATTLGQRQRLASGLREDVELNSRLTDQLGQQADAIRDRAAQQEAANAVYGQGRTAIEAMTLAEMKRQAQDLEATDNIDPKYLKNLYAKIAAQERYVTALQKADYKTLNAGLDEWLRGATEQQRLFQDEQQLAGLTRLERDKVVAARQVELKLAKELAKISQSDLSETEKDALRIKARQAAEVESSAAVAKVVRDDWARTADFVEQSLVDALMRGGKSGFEYVRDLLRTLVLRPVLQTAVQPFSSSVTSAIGGLLGTSGGSGAGIGGGLGGLGGNIGAALGLDKLGLGNLGSLFATIAGPIAAISNLAKGNIATGFGSGLGAVFGGPVGLVLGSTIGSAIDKAFGSVGAKQSGASYLSNGTTGQAVNGGMYGLDRAWGDSIGKYFSQGVQDALKTITGTGANLLNSVSTAFGGMGGYQVGAFFASDNTRASQGNRSILGPNGQVLSSWSGSGLDKDPTKGLEQLTASLAGDVRTALEQINIPGWAKAQLQQLTGGVSFEQLSATVQSILATKDALTSLGAAMPQLANLADGAVEGLLKAFNGIDGLKSAASAYYENFYTDAEKTARATQDLTTQLSALGFSVPTTRDAYRQLVEAQDLNTESGQAAYAQLLKLAPAFAALVPAAQDLSAGLVQSAQQMAEAGRRALAQLAEDNGSLQVELLKAQGDTIASAALARQQALAKLTAGLSADDAAAATAAYDLNAALRQQIDALNEAAAATQRAAQAEAAVASQRDGIQARIDDLLGNTAAIRARELASLDETNRALQQHYYALLDEKTAADAAAQASQNLASQRDAIQSRIDSLLGDTAAIRARELAGIDDSNKALQQQYYDLLDAKAAQEAAAQAAQEAARAAEQLRDAWKGIGDTLVEEAQRILGLNTTSGALSVAQAQSKFTIATAQARSGDQDAARLLPELGRTVLELVGNTATSRADLERARAQVAASLQGTANLLGGMFGFSTQSTSPSVDVQALLAQVASTAPIATATQRASSQDAASMLVEEVIALRAEVAKLREAAARTADAGERTADATERTRDLVNNVTEGGRAMQTEAYS